MFETNAILCRCRDSSPRAPGVNAAIMTRAPKIKGGKNQEKAQSEKANRLCVYRVPPTFVLEFYAAS